MGQIFTKLNKRRSTATDEKSSEKGGQSESKQDEKKEQTLAQKADSMQEVMPNIYMGSYAAAKSKELLQSQKITHILAIGWDLKAHFENDFEYLIFSQVEDNPAYTILKHFDEAFKFMDSCLVPNSNTNNKNDSNNENESKTDNNSNNNKKKEAGRLFVHCHKGLSRSASIIMGYEMSRKKKTFEQVLNEIRESRSFIMPNIGFQAQLQVFQEKNYSLNMEDYDDLDVMSRISNIIPKMYDSVLKYSGYYASDKEELVDGQELFGLTMYFHQLFMLHRERDLPEKDVNTLNQAIKELYKIQTDYIKIDSSITRFEKLFKLGKYNKPSKREIAKQKQKEKEEKEKEKQEQNKKENESKESTNNNKNNDNNNDKTNNNENETKNDNNDENEKKTETFLNSDNNNNNNNGDKKDKSPRLNATPAAELAMMTALDSATQASEADNDSDDAPDVVKNDTNETNGQADATATAAKENDNGNDQDNAPDPNAYQE